MTSRSCIVWGNLKMHPASKLLLSYHQMLASEGEAVFRDFGLVVPYPYLHQAKELFASKISVAAQSISEHQSGAYSSQVSGEILQDLDVGTVMIGHSEVRKLGVDVRAQLAIAQSLGMKVVYCIGEDASAYQSGERDTLLAEQLSALSTLDNVIIAYEPIWSIGTGVVASVSDINAAFSVINSYLASRFPSNSSNIQVLYGGSINNNNCLEIFTKTEVSGFLVGGVSLHPEKILEVIRLCS